MGMVAKVRPVLVLSVQPAAAERVVVTFVNRTLSVRGTSYEVPHRAGFGLEAGAFDGQGLGTLPAVKFFRRIGAVDSTTLMAVEQAVKSWLALK